jgi:phospholipase C
MMKRARFAAMAAMLATPFVACPPAVASQAPTTPIRHFVVLMQENHTFDNYFGTYPGVDGVPKGTCIPVHPADDRLPCVRPFHLGSNGVQPADLDHSEKTYRLQYNGGRMNGFIRALVARNQDGRLAMAYYDDRDLPYYWNLADRFAIFDHLFSSAAAGSSINHMFWVAGRAGSRDGSVPPESTFPTIFDRLEQHHISWKFYVQNYDPHLTYRTLHRYPGNRASQVTWVPLLNLNRFLDRPRLRRHIVDLGEYYTDLHRGTLPAVAYIAPSGPSEHPPSSVASGQAFVRALVNALMESPSWRSSALMVAYDDWGGWYDHVRPPRVDRAGFGFRVPGYLVSPYARRGYVDHDELDFASILRFIEENWSLRPLTHRDRRAGDLSGAFAFDRPPRRPQLIPSVRGAAAQPPAKAGLIYVGYGLALAVAGILVLRAARASQGTPKPGDGVPRRGS